MKLSFTKMQGAGNDFVVLDGVRQQITLTPAQIRWLANRHFGVGADQVLLVEPATNGQADFRYRIFNADGGEVEQCGNGARCLMKFLLETGLTPKKRVAVQVSTGITFLQMQEDGEVLVELTAPVFTPEVVSFDTSGLLAHTSGDSALWSLDTNARNGAPVELCIVSMGNPHAVQRVENVLHASVAVEGPEIASHPRFLHGVNVGFMQVLDWHHIDLRVYERGAGETLACGTGACAAAVAGMRQSWLDSPVKVRTRGGCLTVHWSGDPSEPVYMAGPAHIVFTGEVHCPDELYAQAEDTDKLTLAT